MCMSKCKNVPEDCCEDEECDFNYCCSMDMGKGKGKDTNCMSESMTCMKTIKPEEELKFVNCIARQSRDESNMGCLQELMGNDEGDVGMMCTEEIMDCLGDFDYADKMFGKCVYDNAAEA